MANLLLIDDYLFQALKMEIMDLQKSKGREARHGEFVGNAEIREEHMDRLFGYLAP